MHKANHASAQSYIINSPLNITHTILSASPKDLLFCRFFVITCLFAGLQRSISNTWELSTPICSSPAHCPSLGIA